MTSRVVRREEIVGTYKTVNIIHCRDCHQDTIVVRQYAKAGEEWLADLERYEPWVCPQCHAEQYSPHFDLGIRFQCPNCQVENVQALEPRRIDLHEGDRFYCYSNTEIICLYCDAVFGMAAFFDDTNHIDPNTWCWGLYRK